MKSILIFILVLFFNLAVSGQNLFLIGEKSYSCTDAIELKANSGRLNLNVFFGKDRETRVVAVNIRGIYQDSRLCGKLIIFLKDGNVITCNVIEKAEKVDYIAKAMYKLTPDQLNKLKVSNIHTVKYSICGRNDGDYSASNQEIETSMIISNFFND